MRRNVFYHNNPDFAPQNYHYQQMNGNQLVNHHSPCNCIKLKFCNPVMEMARKMYSGFIADYINSQLQVIACNYIDGEMAVCCPKSVNTRPDSREKRDGHVHGHACGHGRHHGFEDKKWVWDSTEVASSEDAFNSKAHKYPANQYTSYPIQGFLPYSNNPFLKNIKNSPFLSNHEDPLSMKNCPPAFSAEFKLPTNHTYYKEKEIVTTPISRIADVTTQTPPTSIPVPPEMRAKMSLINDESCGRSVGSRIIGGEDAGIGRFSWMGRLAYRNKSNFRSLTFISTYAIFILLASGRISYRCAGSLIADRYVLTAGHCVSNLIETIEL